MTTARPEITVTIKIDGVDYEATQSSVLSVEIASHSDDYVILGIEFLAPTVLVGGYVDQESLLTSGTPLLLGSGE